MHDTHKAIKSIASGVLTVAIFALVSTFLSFAGR